jgi:hypothetical protein
MPINSFNDILERNDIIDKMKMILTNYEENCKTTTFKKGIYIYGSPGSGKTFFVVNLLKQLNYNIIKYDAEDIRNKALIETITSNNISNQNVLDMMMNNKKKIAIIMDEIDSMNNGDKGGITALVKLIRQKKTKKQKLESETVNPIICIGNYLFDKKIKELMKVCHVFEIKMPNEEQTNKLVKISFPNMEEKIQKQVATFIEGDMRKLSFINDIYKKKPHLITEQTIKNIFHVKSFNKDSKQITRKLIESPPKIEEYNEIINETDRTIVALLWHENIVDSLTGHDPRIKIPFYLKILQQTCFADYMDRVTFQNQIWIFNEMTSLIKTFYNNKIFHDYLARFKLNHIVPDEIRFTKVLTKYSTEYNNISFIYHLCMELNMDKKDVISFFQELRLFYQFDTCDKISDIDKIFESYDISKLDIRRIYRYLDKNIKKEAITDETIITESDDDEL